MSAFGNPRSDAPVSSAAAGLFAEIEAQFLDVYANWLSRERRQPAMEIKLHPELLPVLISSIPVERRAEFLRGSDAVLHFYDLSFRTVANHPRGGATVWVNGVCCTAIVA